MTSPAEPLAEPLAKPAAPMARPVNPVAATSLFARHYMDKHRDLMIQFMKFGTVGGFCFFFDYGLVKLLIRYTQLGHYWSAYASFPITATLVWLGNRLYTFRGQNNGSVHAQWLRFLSSCLFGLVINRGTYTLMVATMPLAYHHPIIALAGGTGAGMFFNFFAAKRLVFK